MKNLLWLPVILFFSLVACDDDNDEPRPDNEVWMSTHSFLPANLVVTQGTTVRWMNNSSVTHNLVSAAGLFDELLNPGQSFSYTFSETGLFNYECTIHPGMTGSVTVGDADDSQEGGGDGNDGYYP